MINTKQLLFFLISMYLFINTLKSEETATLSEILKISATNEFNNNTSLLQNIILEAESPDQITDFANKFNSQKIWFDKTLRSSKNLSDPYYNQIKNKNSQLDFIATAIKKCNALIENLELTSEQKRQVRLKFLYEINHMQKEQALSDAETRRITINIIETVSGKKESEFPELKLAKARFKEKSEILCREMLELQITNRELLNKIDNNQTNEQENKNKINLEIEIHKKETETKP